MATIPVLFSFEQIINSAFISRAGTFYVSSVMAAGTTVTVVGLARITTCDIVGYRLYSIYAWCVDANPNYNGAVRPFTLQ